MGAVTRAISARPRRTRQRSTNVETSGTSVPSARVLRVQVRLRSAPCDRTQALAAWSAIRTARSTASAPRTRSRRATRHSHMATTGSTRSQRQAPFELPPGFYSIPYSTAKYVCTVVITVVPVQYGTAALTSPYFKRKAKEPQCQYSSAHSRDPSLSNPKTLVSRTKVLGRIDCLGLTFMPEVVLRQRRRLPFLSEVYS